MKRDSAALRRASREHSINNYIFHIFVSVAQTTSRATNKRPGAAGPGLMECIANPKRSCHAKGEAIATPKWASEFQL